MVSYVSGKPFKPTNSGLNTHHGLLGLPDFCLPFSPSGEGYLVLTLSLAKPPHVAGTGIRCSGDSRNALMNQEARNGGRAQCTYFHSLSAPLSIQL